MMLLLALAAQVSFVEPTPYPPDIDCENYRDGSTVAMVECLGRQSADWERRLALEFSAALTRGEIEQSKLQAAQKAWTAYRDANCDAYGTVRGSISRILTARCWRDMARYRALELRNMVWIG